MQDASRARRRHRSSLVVFYVLHQDFWFWRAARPLVFGFMPIGLFYHAAFTAACAGLLWLLVTLRLARASREARRAATRPAPRR